MVIEETKEILVGAVVFAVFALALGLSHGGTPDAAGPVQGYVLHGNFGKVDGLVPGDEVRMGGVRIGTVESQTLNSNYRAQVGMWITADIELPADTSAAIHTDGLFGSKYVVLEPGGADETLQDGDSIEFTQDAVIVSELLELIIAEGKARQAQQD